MGWERRSCGRERVSGWRCTLASLCVCYWHGRCSLCPSFDCSQCSYTSHPAFTQCATIPTSVFLTPRRLPLARARPPQVSRTRLRPLASGALSPQAAVVFLGLQLLLGLGVLLQLNEYRQGDDGGEGMREAFSE